MRGSPPQPRPVAGLLHKLPRVVSARDHPVHFTHHIIMKNKSILLTTITTVLLAGTASACDFCAGELPSMGLEGRTGLRAGVSTQFTHFGTLQHHGHAAANPAGEQLDSSITHFIIGYDFAHALGVQLSVPVIHRSFRRLHHGVLENGSVSGVGDVSFLAHWAPIHIQRSDVLFTARFFAGLSLPSGDSSRVLEEAGHHEKSEHHEEGEESESGEETASGVHGHDLALGTGGVSGIFGVDARVQWKRLFATAGIQGTVRLKGANDYKFADEMIWHGSLGAVLVDEKQFTLTLAAECNGSSKGQDVFRGVRATDTASTIFYLGPKLSATWQERYHAEVGVEFPVLNESTGVQIVPDYRISATVGVRF